MPFGQPARRIAVTLASAGVVAATVVALLPNADATESSPLTMSAVDANKLSHTLLSMLGPDVAGSYYESGRLVVNVTSASAADAVQESGAIARTVDNSAAALDTATTTLRRQAALPGTAWAEDPRTNQVVVTADRTVKGNRLAKLNGVVHRLGGRARMETSTGEFKPFAAGGDAIFADGARCSLGFNVIREGKPYFLTAGHCGVFADRWSNTSDGVDIGRVEGASFPGNDYAIVKYTSNVDRPSAVDLYNGEVQRITSAADPTIGQKVQRSGSTTQVHSGTVTGLNVTVNYPEGSVDGLIQTNVCAEPGDSGGSLFAGGTALGLTSGGSGDCATGGETFFQPVSEALSRFGAEIG